MNAKHILLGLLSSINFNTKFINPIKAAIDSYFGVFIGGRANQYFNTKAVESIRITEEFFLLLDNFY